MALYRLGGPYRGSYLGNFLKGTRMSTRLLISMIETIMTNFEPTVYKKERKQLEAQRTKLAQAVAAHAYPKPPASMTAEDQQTWLHFISTIWVGGMSNPLKLPNPIPIPAFDTNSVSKADLSPALRDRLKAYCEVKNKLDVQVKKTCQDIEALLRSCRTVEQIKQKWPDGYSECMKILFPNGQASGYAVTAPISEINKALGLPKDEHVKA